jgi:lipopolysaccharide/colanic/teichoic acid biosynthesis glycosyltransferase
MKQSPWQSREYASALLDLLACIAGFGAAALIEYAWMGNALPERTSPWIFPPVLSATIAWFAMVFPESQWHEGLRLWVDGFLTIVGSNLLIQCGLTYLFGIEPATWLVIFAGSALSMGAAGLLRKWIPASRSGGRKGILLVGCDDAIVSLANSLHERIIGGLERSAKMLPPKVPFLGGIESLTEVCETRRPGTVIVCGKPASGLSGAELLKLHYAGVEIESAPFLYERVTRRVAWQYMQPSELLFFLNPGANRAMLAFQAIYKNVLGLALRLISAPLLILLSVLIVVTTGSPALEPAECLGYQRIPFQRLSFRVHRADGSLSGIGKLIEKLRLTNLPQLINVVRGEMTLFGPAPVRTALANRLSELLPAYIYRFTIKPGILGWYQADLAEAGGLPDEIQRLECDLYYIRQESPSLDLDILLRTLALGTPAKKQAEPVASMVRNS